MLTQHATWNHSTMMCVLLMTVRPLHSVSRETTIKGMIMNDSSRMETLVSMASKSDNAYRLSKAANSARSLTARG